MSVQQQTNNSNSSSAAEPSSLVAKDKPSAPAKEKSVEFIAQSKSVYVYRPEEAKNEKESASSSVLSPISMTGPSPTAVVIMGWMDAPLRIVTKYAAPYAKLFPQATIVIKLSTGRSFVAKREAREASLEKMITVLEEVNATLSADSSIIIHSFSDGGAYNLSELLRLSAGRKVPQARAMIFDCSPGSSTPYSSSTALTLPLSKRPFIRSIFRGILYVYFTIILSIKRLIGTKTWSQVLRGHLNNPQLWKWTESKPARKSAFPPRLYLYSKTDALISWKAVEDHAREAAKVQGLNKPLQIADLATNQEAAKKGSIVACRRWEQANHCDLGRADFDGYWKAVRTFLEAVL